MAYLVIFNVLWFVHSLAALTSLRGFSPPDSFPRVTPVAVCTVDMSFAERLQEPRSLAIIVGAGVVALGAIYLWKVGVFIIPLILVRVLEQPQ